MPSPKNQRHRQIIQYGTDRYVSSLPDPTVNDFVIDIVVYDLCGYLLIARPSITKCLDFLKKTVIFEELDLPEDFTANHYTASRDRGGLTYVTPKIFRNNAEN